MQPAFHSVLAATNKIPRPQVSEIGLNLFGALFIMVAFNATFWQRGYEIFHGQLFTLLVFGAAIWALTLLIITLFGFRWLQKPVLVFLLILSAITSYYVDTLGATIDRDMVQNAMTSTFTETKHLITPVFLIHVVLYGVVPSAVVLWLRVRRRRLWRNLWTWGMMTVVSAALFVGLLLSDFKTYSEVLRDHHELAGSYQPGAPLAGTLRYVKMMIGARTIKVEALGLDARKGPLLTTAAKPVLTVIFVGETARAQSFSLNGYDRDTNPELATRNVINFSNVDSCGTATAVSLPCMFSNLGRTEYSYKNGIGTENLLDVLTHAGVHVEWWDNNTGDKDIADRVSSRRLNTLKNPEFCTKGECNDGIFLGFVQDYVADMTEDTVLVLHQIGSHGPAYYLRYPAEFERFTPDCRTAEFSECTVEEIRNSYDNTILYTNHVMAQMIDFLAWQDRVIPAMIYVSDHGESLGEDGLYLHGAPYFIAPETQTKVPMMLWMSDDFKAALGVNDACVVASADQLVSHDNLFHSVLGLMDIQTSVRQAGLDLVAGCRHSAS